MSLDERMFEIGSYITNEQFLLEVIGVRTTSQFPKRRVITVENCRTGKTLPLKETELAGFRYVESDRQKTLTATEQAHYTLVPDHFPLAVT